MTWWKIASLPPVSPLLGRWRFIFQIKHKSVLLLYCAWEYLTIPRARSLWNKPVSIPLANIWKYYEKKECRCQKTQFIPYSSGEKSSGTEGCLWIITLWHHETMVWKLRQSPWSRSWLGSPNIRTPTMCATQFLISWWTSNQIP